MPASAARAATAASIAFHDVLSDDGTRLRAWTNDPDGTIDGPTVVLCNPLGTSPWTWPALLRPECGVRVGIGEFVEDGLSVLDHFGVALTPIASRLPVGPRGIEGATYVELRGSHFIQMEQPDRVHALLVEPLERVA